MRDRVNIPIDYRLKQMFEDLIQVHGTTWAEILENAVLEELMKNDPVQALEYKLRRGNESLEYLQRSLARTKMNIAVLQEKAVVKHKQPDPELEKRRESLFERDRTFFEKLSVNGKLFLSLNQGGPNWAWILSAYSFKDKKEGESWIIKRIEEEVRKRTLKEIQATRDARTKS